MYGLVFSRCRTDKMHQKTHLWNTLRVQLCAPPRKSILTVMYRSSSADLISAQILFGIWIYRAFMPLQVLVSATICSKLLELLQPRVEWWRYRLSCSVSVFENCHLSLASFAPRPAPDQFSFDGFENRLDSNVTGAAALA
jgi:hypothetical protein